MPLSTRRAATTKTTTRPPAPSARAAVARVARAAFEALEDRRLFAAVAVGTVPTQAGTPNGTTTVNLNTYFNDDAVELVQFSTPLGNYRLKLLEKLKPVTVANFMSYVASGAYNGTIIHRSAALVNATPDIIQGGGYSAADPANHIPTSAPITNEYFTNGVLQNTRGTIAMARTSALNSATSEFFINSLDTSTALNDEANQNIYAVFGNVVDADLPVIDAIAALTPRDLSSTGIVDNGALTDVPLRNYTDADLAAKKVPTADNYVTETAARLPDVTYAVTSSNPSVATPTVAADGTLSLAYGATEGQADITVTATSVTDGSTVSRTFAAASGATIVTLGGDTGASAVTFKDADGTVGTLTIKGPGSAAVRFGQGGLTQAAAKGKVAVTGDASLDLVTLTGTTAATTVTISGKGGDKVLTLAGLSADGAVKSISAKTVALAGGLTTSGAVGSLALGSATGSTINLGGSSADAAGTITVGAMADTDLSTNAPMKSVKLAGATNTDADPDLIQANAGLAALSVTGDLANDVTVPGDFNLGKLTVGGALTGNLTAHQIGAVSVRGAATGSTVTATHDASESASAAEANQKQNLAIGSFKVGGAMSGVTIQSAGSVGSVSAGSIADSVIFAGPTGSALPVTAAALTDPATIGSLKARSLSNTQVAARFLGKLSVGTVAVGTAGQSVGFAADTIAALSGTVNGKKLALKKAGVQADATAALGTLGGLGVTTPGTSISGGAGTVLFADAAGDGTTGTALTILLV